MIRKILQCLVAVMCCVKLGNSNFVEDQTNLIGNMSSSYNTNVAPDTQVVLSFEFGLLYINSLDTRTERFQLMGFFIVTWFDGRLMWTPTDFGNSTYVKAKFSNIWTPPLIIGNSAEGIKFINDDSDLSSTRVKVDYTGSVAWLSPVNVDAQCSMDIQFYPFDFQECSVIVSSWMYSEDEIDLTFMSGTEINLDLYSENGEWTIVTREISSSERSLHGFAMPYLEFKVGLKRKYSYYLLNMMLPVVLLTLIGPLVFALPVESGEKNGFALTILLSLSVMITVVSDLIPPSSKSVSILSVYLLTAYMMSIIQGFAVVLVCRTHNRTNKGETPGRTASKICNLLENILCYSKEKRCSKTSRVESIETTNASNSQMKKIDVKGDIERRDLDGGSEAGDSEHSYEHLANLIDHFCLYAFYILTLLITIIFMTLLAAGGP